MRVLITGHNGYIGSVVAPLVQAAAMAKVGTELVVDVRGRLRTAEVVKKPIYVKEH